ncbi:MAG: type IV toxin-antitoxin system AbiEi family antitoxin domain-containing protein [Candidatus Omnitrophica bacterium]|nr:type IV toxin-antitoxin system AbiEi family antitoxin domain-containing protein [Candidatus Omnitrophota bacterium]
MQTKQDQIIEFIKKNGGFASSGELIKGGFYKAVIYSALKSGLIDRVRHGVYGLAGTLDFAHPDLVTASIVVPNGVICLITALSFYEVTDEIPRQIDIAVTKGYRDKVTDKLPLKLYYFSRLTWKQGMEEHDIDGQKIKIYSLAKTIADCFKFRNQIGMNIARSALKNALEQKKVDHREIMKYASICRVTNIIKPILETLI